MARTLSTCLSATLKGLNSTAQPCQGQPSALSVSSRLLEGSTNAPYSYYSWMLLCRDECRSVWKKGFLIRAGVTCCLGEPLLNAPLQLLSDPKAQLKALLSCKQA